ncbi:unnamed protein product [Closterium sp. NIES-54]
MTTLRVLLHVAAQRDYELHSLDFSTAFLQGSLHEEIWLRRPPGFTGSFPPDTQWSLRRPVYGLRQAPREWHDTLRTTLAALGFAPSTADPLLFLRTDTSLPPFYVLVTTLAALGFAPATADPSLFLRTDTSLPPFYVLVYLDDLVFPTADTEALTLVKSELQKRHICTNEEPFGEVSTMAGLEKRGGRGAGGSGEAQAHGQPRDSAMAPVQPSLGPPRDEPRVFGLDKFNGDNFAEWSFRMENVFDHYDLLEVMEGTEKCPKNDPEKSPGARGGRGRGRGGRGGRGGGGASMKSAGNESELKDDRFPGQFFFVSTQAPAGPENDEGFEEPAAVGKVTLHSLDYWVIDSGATYSMTPRADLLTELEPSPVKHVTSALGQRAEVKGMGKAMFKGADGKMVGLKNVLQRFRFQFSSPQPTPLSTSHSLSAPPSDESVEPSGPYPELVGCLITSGMGLVLGGRGPVVLTRHADAFWVDDSATQRSSQGYTFSLGSGSVFWRSSRSSSVLSSSCEAEIYAGAMAAQELLWLTYLLTNLGEQPHSPPDLYVDNKALIALCEKHRLEQRTKHIALRYFLARELQQRGQLRLAYVTNTADVFTKALPPGDHQRFVTVLGLVPTLHHLLTA